MPGLEATRTVTIVELATARGITRKAARALASRRRWPKRKGNDGCLRIDVPNVELQAVPQAMPSDDTKGGHGAVSHDSPKETLGTDIRAELEEARITLATISAKLEAETERTTELRADRDRWAELADALRTELDGERNRSLFNRLFGRAA